MRYPENYSGVKTDRELVGLWLSGRPETTKDAYLRDSTEFLTTLGEKGLQEAMVADLIRWAETLTGADATKARKIASVKSLFSYAHRVGYTVFDVGRALRVPKILDRLAERIVDEDTVREVIGKASDGRDRILLRFMYVTGCRVTEAISARFIDIGPNNVTFHGKGAKTRTVLVPMELVKQLKSLRWKGDHDDAYIFKSVRGRQLSRQDGHRIVCEACDQAGVKMSSHWFRHAHASHAMQRGASLALIMSDLGHSNIATTSRYLHVFPTEGSAQFLVTV